LVTTKRFEQRIELSIKDNGTGIPYNVVEKINRVFYYKTNWARNWPGIITKLRDCKCT
jgi:signal transduction histidine kinase